VIGTEKTTAKHGADCPDTTARIGSDFSDHDQFVDERIRLEAEFEVS
jgi:hypothetical protein